MGGCAKGLSCRMSRDKERWVMWKNRQFCAADTERGRAMFSLKKKNRFFVLALSSVVFTAFSCSDDGSSVWSPEGKSCKDDSECSQSMQCIQGGCSSKWRNGSACSSDQVCLSGFCREGICTVGEEPPLPDVNACETDKDCAKGYCIDKACREQAGAYCSSVASCGEGLECRQMRCVVVVPGGGKCVDNAAYYCTMGSCIDGVCTLLEEFHDTDGDTIADIYDRCDVDTDGDTVPNCEDLDSDGDTIPDSVEAGNGGNPAIEPIDSDDDTIPDFLDTDSDDNGIPDMYEGCQWKEYPYTGADSALVPKDKICSMPVDTDGDTIPDYRSWDNDGDGVTDKEEIAGVETFVDGENVPGRHCNGVPCAPGTPAAPWDSDGDTVPDYLDSDSDGDTIPDLLEGYADSDNDGILDRYSLDSDGDTIPDSNERDVSGNLLRYTDERGVVTYCFQSADCDNDGVLDIDEPSCNGVSGINTPDTDGDGYPDATEITAGQYAIVHGLLDGSSISSIDDIVCDPNKNVKDVFDFYFELPYQGETKDDILEFIPKVSKLDLVFNVDTTGSMTTAIQNVKNNIGNTIQRIKNMVPDSGIALTNFDDYPAGVFAPTISTTSGDITFYQMFGSSESGDLPFRVLGKISTDSDVVTSYTQNPLFKTRNGEDGAESGVESLYQIATGVGTSWNAGSASGKFIHSCPASYPANQICYGNETHTWSAGSTPANVNAPGTWGGVDFRDKSLPVVIHTTDIYSHDAPSPYMLGSFTEYQYNQVNQAIVNPHYTPDLIPVLKANGIRVITLGVLSNSEKVLADELGQMTTWARESNAVVPACAFEDKCGPNKCCLGTTVSDAVKLEDGRDNQCILYYTSEQTDVSEVVTNGVSALVKYGTFDVSTRISGEPIPNSTKTTACFVKQVMAKAYLPPPQEPEKSCNPTAIPSQVEGADYQNGFTNFAPGTADPNVDGARLHFTVVAQNDDCVEPAEEAQVFKAYIDVVNPTTGLVFGRRQVFIIVPAKPFDIIN